MTHKCDDSAGRRRETGSGAAGCELRGRGASTAPRRTPEATTGFGLTQALVAGTGACAASALSRAVGYPVAVVAAACVLAAALTAQFRTQAYTVWVYWAAMTASGVTGALVGGGGRDEPENLFACVTLAGAVISTAVVGARRFEAGMPSPAHRGVPALETLYWSAMLGTFAAGAGAARLVTVALPMGHALSPVVFAVLVVGCLAVRQLTARHVAACTWMICLMARPLGVSFAQWLATPLGHGGLGWGQGPVTVLLGVLVAGQLGRLAERERIGPAAPGLDDRNDGR